MLFLNALFFGSATVRALLTRRVRCDACGDYTKPVGGRRQHNLFRCDGCLHYLRAPMRFPWAAAVLSGCIAAVAYA